MARFVPRVPARLWELLRFQEADAVPNASQNLDISQNLEGHRGGAVTCGNDSSVIRHAETLHLGVVSQSTPR